MKQYFFQGYFRKGCALFGLGKYEEAVVALLQCLALDTSIDTAREYLSKVRPSLTSLDCLTQNVTYPKYFMAVSEKLICLF